MGLRFLLGLSCALSLCVDAFSASSRRWINSAPCVQLCGVIESCAEKSGHPELSRLLCHMSACEVGKFCARKEIRSPNGLFHGPFQFTRATWRTVCQPLFKDRGVTGCSGKKSIYNTCCATQCATQLVADNLNGGVGNWPQCGPVAQRAVASESKSAK